MSDRRAQRSEATATATALRAHITVMLTHSSVGKSRSIGDSRVRSDMERAEHRIVVRLRERNTVEYTDNLSGLFAPRLPASIQCTEPARLITHSQLWRLPQKGRACVNCAVRAVGDRYTAPCAERCGAVRSGAARLNLGSPVPIWSCRANRAMRHWRARCGAARSRRGRAVTSASCGGRQSAAIHPAHSTVHAAY